MRSAAQALSTILSRLRPRIRAHAGGSGGAALALGISLLLTACGTTAPIRSAVAGSSDIGTPVTIYVVRRSWHIDVGVAAEQVAAPLSTLRAQFPGVRYLLFGFGDRHYLEARNRGLPAMVAALWPGDGLLLVTAVTGTPAAAFGEQAVIELRLNATQARLAQERVLGSLSLRDGALQSDGAGPYEGSIYLRAAQRYSAFHTCTTWAAEVLQAAGLPVHSRGVLFAGQLWRQVRRIADDTASRQSATGRFAAVGADHGRR